MQAQLLQNSFSVPHQRFVLLVTLLWMRELEHLHFLKLVLPQDAARIFSGRTGFRAETGGPRRKVNGQLLFRQRRIAIEVMQLYFRSRCEPEVGVLQFEQVRREFRKLSRAH